MFLLFKVMPYSTACNTPLSNFESGQNYKEVVDPAGRFVPPDLKIRSLLFLVIMSVCLAAAQNED